MVSVLLCVRMCTQIGGITEGMGEGSQTQKAGVDWCARCPQPSPTQTQGDTQQSPQVTCDTSMSYWKEPCQGRSRDLRVPILDKAQGQRSPSVPPQGSHTWAGGGQLHTAHIIKAKNCEQLPRNSAAGFTNLFFQRGWVLNLFAPTQVTPG